MNGIKLKVVVGLDTSESCLLEGRFKEPSPVIGRDHHFSCLRSYQLRMVDSAEPSTILTRSSRQSTLIFLKRCFNSPKAQSGANFVWPTIKKDMVMDLMQYLAVVLPN